MRFGNPWCAAVAWPYSLSPFLLFSFSPFLLFSFPPFLLSSFPPFLLSSFPPSIPALLAPPRPDNCSSNPVIFPLNSKHQVNDIFNSVVNFAVSVISFKLKWLVSIYFEYLRLPSFFFSSLSLSLSLFLSYGSNKFESEKIFCGGRHDGSTFLFPIGIWWPISYLIFNVRGGKYCDVAAEALILVPFPTAKMDAAPNIWK